jgi:hypothetical protein
MSALALASTRRAARRNQQISELDATRQISRTAAVAPELVDGIESVIKVALQIPGINRVELSPGKPLLPQIPELLAFGPTDRSSTSGVAFAEVKADGKLWGELRVFFELRPLTLENPLRFARYVGQQLGVMLVRAELLVQQDVLRQKADRYKTVVARRKAIHRARALLRHAHNISDDEAFLLMRRYVEQTGRTMHQIAEAIVLSDQQKWSQPREFPVANRSTFRRKTAHARL